MVAGILFDLLLIAAVAGFGYAGYLLGFDVAARRFVGSVVAFLLAAALARPAGGVLESLLGASEDFSRLLAMILIGIAVYLAIAPLTTYVLHSWESRRASALVDDVLASPVDDPYAGELDPRLAIIPGALTGLVWGVVFFAVLVLLPASNFISNGAIASRTGWAVIAQKHGLKWLNNTFPHYTQTLPKGSDGAVVGERDSIPLRLTSDPEITREDEDVLVANINQLRRDTNALVLTWNPDISEVAARHAKSLMREGYLSDKTPGGQDIRSQLLSAASSGAAQYESEIGLEVVWAHSSANALQGLAERRESFEQITDGKWTEIGIGIVDGGYFNGRIYVIAFIQRAVEEEVEFSDAIEPESDLTDEELFVEPGADVPSDDTLGDEDPFEDGLTPQDDPDTDGDGLPDDVDPDPLTPNTSEDPLI